MSFPATVKSTTATTNEGESENLKNHVVWNIDAFKRQDLAIRFAQDINQRLCVYSSTLRHVYGEYSIETITNGVARLVVVPQTYSLERFIDIREEAVVPTGVHIYPGWYFKLNVPYVMTLPIRTKRGENRSRPISPNHGFQIMEKTAYKEPFLPLLKNGDLREFDRRTPYLHLHRLVPNLAPNLSRFDVNQLSTLIQEKRTRMMKVE